MRPPARRRSPRIRSEAPSKRRDSRAHRRFPVAWRARLVCASWDHVARVVLGNASRSGLFVKTGRSLSEGARVELSLELPNGTELRLGATVIHVRGAGQTAPGRPAGVGLRFDAEHVADLILLESMAAAGV